jgi:nucleoside-diphosphate-sugar epimerase
VFKNQIKSTGKVTVTGDGSQSRDFISVTDVALANLIAAENINKVNGEVFNVSSGSTISILEVAKFFKVPIEFIDERPGEARVSWGDNSKILERIPWKPTTSLQDYIKFNF